MGLVAGTKNVVPATRISIQNTSTHYGTGPRSKSLQQVPATSPLVCADLKVPTTDASADTLLMDRTLYLSRYFYATYTLASYIMQ